MVLLLRIQVVERRNNREDLATLHINEASVRTASR